MLHRLLWKMFSVQLSIVLVHGICSFPDYTAFNQKWETMISQERHTVGAHWIFNQTTAEFMSLTKVQVSDVYSCDQELSNNFLIRLNPKNTKTEQSLSENGNDNEPTMAYRCMQLFKYSDSILQMKLSPLAVLGSIEQLCSGSNSMWESYILVWPRMINYEACPVVGGFQFSMTDPYDNKLCANMYLPPVLESRCAEEEEGIYIDFRNFNCRGKLGMQLNQKLRCLGNWIEGNFTFSVTSGNDEMWPRLWLFRFPIDTQQDNFTAEILSEIKVVTTENIETTTDHYTMHLSRQVFKSTCEDEAVTCNNCNNSNILVYCQKSCNACNTNQIGNFSNNTNGNWIQFSSSGIKNVTVSTSSMQIGDTTFSPINLGMSKWYKTKDRKVMSLVFNNGCRPRYVCVDFVQRSNSVQQYRLSQYVSWPQTLSMNADDVCNEDLFTEKKSSNSVSGRHKYKTIITANEIQQKVSCGLMKGYFQLDAHFPDQESCKLLMNSCGNNSQTSFSLILSSGCDKSILTENEQDCIAAFTDDTNGDQVMITQDSKTRLAYCWVLHKEEWETRSRFFLTYAADCNSDVAKYILYRNYTGYLSYFDIVTGPDLFGSYNCSRDLSWLIRTAEPNNNVQAPIHKSNYGSKLQGVWINMFIMAIVSCNVALLS